jgi:hypothetical protein
MIKIVHGVVRGNSIQFNQDIGMPEGESVEVEIRTIPKPGPTKSWGDGIRRSAGSLADIPGIEEDMKQILEQRKIARFREITE